ncbi:MAG: hypothetical protein ABI384_02130 [Allobranchiibius sp.]
MSRKRRQATEVIYQRAAVQQRLLLNPRRWLMWALVLAVWVLFAALVTAFLQLESITSVLSTTAGGVIAALLITAVVKPATHQIALSDRGLVVTTRRGDQVYDWAHTREVTVQTARFTNAHELKVERRPGVADEVVVRTDKKTWAALVARMTRVAEVNDVPVVTK